jgi:hypothetical protein
MISDEELLSRIEDIVTNYEGRLDYLNEAIGIIVVGRLMGRDVQQLVSSKRAWSLVKQLFPEGLDDIMRRRERLAKKSVGLKVLDTAKDYWNFINGNHSRDDLPNEERKMLVNS